MNEEVDASVTETDLTQTTPVEATPDVSAGVETVTETPAVSAAPETPAEPQMRGLLEVMRERGWATQHERDEDALQDLIQQAQRARQYEPYVAQIQQHWTPFQQYLASQQQQAAKPAEPAQQAKPYWDKLPEYDPNWVNMVTRNEQGQLVAVPGAQPDLPQKIQAYARAKEAALAKLLADPVEATWGGIEQKLGSVLKPLQDEIQRLKQERTNESVNRYVTENAQYLFQHDEQGRRLLDPTTGQPAFSPYGQAFTHYLNHAAQLGIPTPQQREEYARSLAVAWVQGQGQQAQTPAAQPGQTANDQHKAAYTNGAKRIPNRGGTANIAAGSDSVKQNGSHDLRDMLYADFRRAGLIDATAT